MGNPGEPDFLLKKDNTTLAVIEAVVCAPPVSYQNLTQHFQKLLAYSDCRLFFHLTYADVPSLTSRPGPPQAYGGTRRACRIQLSWAPGDSLH